MADSLALPLYVVVTVSVTPVGNVVMLGVPVLARDPVTDCEPVRIADRVIRGDGVDDDDRLTRAEALTLVVRRAVGVSRVDNETVVEEDCDLLSLVDGV